MSKSESGFLWKVQGILLVMIAAWSFLSLQLEYLLPLGRLVQIARIITKLTGTRIVHPTLVEHFNGNILGNKLAIHNTGEAVVEAKAKDTEAFPFLPPFKWGVHIANLGGTHRLLFNRYPVLESHMLITTERFENQTSQLTEADMLASLSVVGPLHGIAFWNCGAGASMSQPHKHFQVVLKDELGFPLFGNGWLEISGNIQKPEYLQPSTSASDENFYFYSANASAHLPFSFWSARSWHNWTVEERAQKIQTKVVSIRQHSRKEDGKGLSLDSYNLVWDADSFAIIIPRRESSYNGISLNALAFLGHFFVDATEQANAIKAASLAELYRRLQLGTTLL